VRQEDVDCDYQCNLNSEMETTDSAVLADFEEVIGVSITNLFLVHRPVY